VIVDDGGFSGLEGIPAAIDYMYEGKNIGKLVVPLVKRGSQKSGSLNSRL